MIAVVLILVVVSIVHSVRQQTIARALREQAELTHEAFRLIAFMQRVLDATPAERLAMQEEALANLERLNRELEQKRAKRESRWIS